MARRSVNVFDSGDSYRDHCFDLRVAVTIHDLQAAQAVPDFPTVPQVPHEECGGRIAKGHTLADYTPLTDRLIRLPEVKTRTGLGRSSIYRLVATGAFPRPRKLAARAVAWRESDIQTWIDTRL